MTLRRIAALVLGLLLVAGAALWLALPTIASWVLHRRLAEAGIEEASFRVVHVGWSKARIADLRLGDDLTARAVVARYALLDARLESLSLEGLRVALPLPLAGDLPARSRSFALAKAGGRGEGAFPVIDCADCLVELMTPYGPLAVPFEGSAGPSPGGLSGSIAIAGGSIPGPLPASLSGAVDFAVREGVARATARLQLAAAGMTARLDARAEGLGLDASVLASGELIAQPSAALWPLLGLPAPADGSLRLSAAARGRIDDFSGTADAAAEDLAWPGLGALSLAGGIDFAFADALSLSLTEAAAELAPDPALLSSLPAQLAGLVPGPWSISVAPSTLELGEPAAADLSFKLSAGSTTLDARVNGIGTPAPAFDGSLRASLRVPRLDIASVAAEDVAVELDATVTLAAGRVEALLAGPSSIAVAKLSAPGLARPLRALRAALAAADSPFLAFDAAGATHDFVVGPLRAKLRFYDAASYDASFASLRLTGEWRQAYMGRALLRGGAVEGPLALTAIEAEATLTPPKADARLSGKFAGNDWLVPVALAGKARAEDGRVEFSLRIEDAKKRFAAEIAGRPGEVLLKLGPLRFGPRLQPRHLSPALGSWIDEANGTLALEARLGGNAGGSARLLMQDMTIKTAAAELKRLNAVIDFDGLFPPTTPPGQEIAVALVESGLPLADGLLRFRLLPGPRVGIESGKAKLAGGTLSVEPTTLDPLEHPSLALAADGIDLSELVALVAIDGLSATGQLDGRIPVTIEGGDWAVREGKLSARGPGRIAYAPENVPAALASQGASVALALSALGNFHYDKLDLTLTRARGGDMTVGIRVLGKNPDFYEGYPVEFNFNVTGKLDQVLRQSLVGYRVPEAIRRRLAAFGSK